MVRRGGGDPDVPEHSENRKERHIRVSAEKRKLVIEAVRASANLKASAGPSAARSQDFLYESEFADLMFDTTAAHARITVA
jgi:hypothetical protein